MKQKKQFIVLAVLLAILAVVAYSYLQGDQQRVVTADALAASQEGPPPLIGVDNPQLRRDEVERARRTEYKSSGRSIFSREIPPPRVKVPPAIKPGAPGSPSNPVVPPPPPPPVARPIPAKFYGFGVVPNGTRRLAFFAQGDDTYIVGEGEILLKSFRIIRIGNTSLEYEDLSNGVQGTCALEEQGAPSASP